MSTPSPREGMMAVVRNRRAMITGVEAFDAEDAGRSHVVEVEYTDGTGAESDTFLWEVEPGTEVLSPATLPQVAGTPPMDPREFDAMVRSARWAALTPTLPFSGLAEDRPPLASPLYGAIHPEAYQLVPVLRALEMPRVALLLADAVGLGKTIQAGMVIRELMLRRRIRRILVVCPASLRSQWRSEMFEKFALPFDVVDRPGTLRLQRELGLDANPWRTHERIVTSYDYLKQPDVLEQFRSVGEPGEDGRLKWDLLVVDEAHNLAPAAFGVDSDVSKMLQRIAPWFEHRLFLTATPHNGHTRSFSGLLEALDPVRFTRKMKLDDDDRRRVGETVVRRLKSEINDGYVALDEPPRFSDRHVLALPKLRFGPLERELHDAFAAFREELVSAAKAGSTEDQAAAWFASGVLRKRLISGPWAFGQSWLTLMEGVAAAESATSATVARVRDATADDTDDDKERESRQRHAEKTVGAWLRRWKEQLANEIARVSEAVEAIGVTLVPAGLEPATRAREVATRASAVKADARLAALEALLEEELRADGTWRADERIVIFSEYLATLEYLVARLRARYGDAPWLCQLYGGMTDDERDAVKHAFNDARDPARVLVATDAAGEGLNLQRAARHMLHWDIPWNPGRMEQRNGRLDRHGQKRDVRIYHFDSDDDAFLGFMGRVLAKRSRTREDRVVTDEIFADAILAYFQHGEHADDADARLDAAIDEAKAANADIVDDLPAAAPLPGADDQRKLEELKAELDLDPTSLRETLETALAVEAGRPRLQADGRGRHRLVHPVPVLWQELVDHALRQGDETGPLVSLVFDPEQFVELHDGRPVYTPESDARLMHLGDMLYHRVMSTFARYRFPGGPSAATRWTVRAGDVPAGMDALVLLTIEELGFNELREPCHHWVRTVALPVRDGAVGQPLPHRAARDWRGPTTAGDRDAARDIWDDVDAAVKRHVADVKAELTASLVERMRNAGKAVLDLEKKRFAQRRRELEKAMGDTQLESLAREAEALRQRTRQTSLWSEIDYEMQKRLTDLEAEIALRRSHYETVQKVLRMEEERTLTRVLPLRYAVRGEPHVYPIAVEIRLPGGAT